MRLESWKAVATYLGCDVSTARRWEAERGLPIHRLPGGSRSRIYADAAELEVWRRGGGAQTPAPAEPTRPASLARPPARIPTATVWIAAAAVFVLAASGLGWSLLRQPAVAVGATPGPPPLAAEKLYVEGTEAWVRRTPASLNAAMDDFNAALKIDPGYAQAWVGLAKTYNLMREYTQMPDSQAYPLARKAAEHALALNERLPEAHAALAFADYWGFWDADAARAHFQRALALDPGCETAHQWFATFLDARGDHAGAIREMDKALTLDPASELGRVDRGKLLIDADRYDEGIAVLREAEAADPRFGSPHYQLRNIYLMRGLDGDYLREAAALADLTRDPGQQADLETARRGEAHGGRAGMLAALLSARLGRAGNNGVAYYSIAQLYSLERDGPQAIAWLQESLSRRESQFAEIETDPAFAWLRTSPDYRTLIAQIRPS